MKPLKPNGYVLILFAAIVTGIFLVGAARPNFDDPVKSAADKKIEKLIPSLNGADLYRYHCATCHGVDGKGHGPVVPALSVKVPDLTTIAKRNHGEFPADRIRNIISGDEVFYAHGSRDMPIWGPIFHQIENDRDYGNIRLQNVTEHLRSIQQK
ncbi:MAG: c-type cytochrome [Terriglobales bacterium]